MESGWWTVIQTVGLPTGLLLIILFTLYKGAVWAANNLIKPLVTKHIEFLDATIHSMKSIADGQQAIAENHRSMLEFQAKITGALAKVNERLERGNSSV